VVYNHTNEADDANPYVTSFRGIDNKVIAEYLFTCCYMRYHLSSESMERTYTMEPHQFLDEFMRKQTAVLAGLLHVRLQQQCSAAELLGLR